VADPISRLAEELAGRAVPGGGIIVSVVGILGGIAATDSSVPRVSVSTEPSCDPYDLACYRTDVQESDPVSVMGGSVPDWWVGMNAVVAGIVASAIACGLILLFARLRRPRSPG
jgi:hypothetical protein